MNFNKLSAYFFPAFAMLSITALTMYGAFGDTKTNLSIFYLSLVIVFPITFIIQAIACATNRYSILPAIGISAVGFIVIFVLLLGKGEGNIKYGIIYFGLFFITYGLIYLLKRARS